MILNANDFGCVPDGRFLERACIHAGAAVLTDLDGVLRPTDVGKHIAIPGAKDLVATIVRLVEHREVENAQMAAGSHDLIGTLINPATNPPKVEKFDQNVHVGRRITVAEAGPGISTLVTDIEAVLGRDKIRLVAQASQAVSGAEVILNKPDVVALDDYARRCAANLTIDLQDRTINDGEMIIGGRALFSKTAKFSSRYLDKPVTIKEAGLLVTIIESFQSNTKATLAAPAERDVPEGQADVWKTDSRSGLELLLASLESQGVEAVDIQFGPGIYDFKRSPDTKGPMNGIIGLLNKKNLTIQGAGSGVTVLRLMPQQDLEHPNTHVIETRDCKHLTFGDFSLHGASLATHKTNEQMHGIFLNQGSEDIVIEHVRIFQSAGDGLRFLGKKANPQTQTAENKVRNVRVESCQLIQNKRTGLAFQRAVEFVSVRNCYIEMIPPSSDSCIDLEPSGLAPTDLVFESNVMKHATPAPAVSISGSEAKDPDPARRIKFSDNEINGGHIFCTNVHQLTIQNNAVRVDQLGEVSRVPIYVTRGDDSLMITGNLLVNDDPTTKTVILLEGVNEVKRALVANNLCFARAGMGIQCLSSDDITIEGNMILATDSCNSGIFVRSESSAVDHLSVRNNDITVRDAGKWKYGIRLAALAPNPIRGISMIGNSIRHADNGIFFEGTAYLEMPVCALNRIADGVPFVGMMNLKTGVVVGGITSIGGTTNPGLDA